MAVPLLVMAISAGGSPVVWRTTSRLRALTWLFLLLTMMQGWRERAATASPSLAVRERAASIASRSIRIKVLEDVSIPLSKEISAMRLAIR